MSGDGERDDRGPPLPKPRFQASPERENPGSERKPLPRHSVKQILDASNARNRWRDPLLLEMQARARAKREATDKKDKDG